MPEFELRVDGGRTLQAIVEGPAEGPLVIAHGGTPSSARELYPPHVAVARARGVRLASYSRPGYAESDRDPGRSVASCAADCAAVADTLGAERFFTFGGSGGGPHALACAALLPQQVLAAATIAGAAPADVEDLDWLDGMGAENIEEFEAARAGPQALEDYLDRFAAELREITGEEVLGAFGDLVSEPDARVLTGEYAEFAAGNLRHSVSSGIWGWFDDDLALTGAWGFDPGAIEVPVTVWQGRQDRFVPPAHGEWLAARVAGASSHLLSEHGHLSLALAHFDAILGELMDAAG